MVGQRKGPSGENSPPVHGIKKCLVEQSQVLAHLLFAAQCVKNTVFESSLGPVYEFVCVSFTTGNLNCFRVK